MNAKEFFRPTWPKLIWLAVFNILAGLGVLRFSGIAGVHIGSGLFNIFSFLVQFKCEVLQHPVCAVWNPLLVILAIGLNLVWQYLLACLVVLVVRKARER